MPDYTNHTEVIELLDDAQEAEHDLRQIVRETHHFLDKRDGQWEPDIWDRFKGFGRPRYTFDMCNPIVDQISGELEQADFDITCKAADGDASEDVAKTIDGLIRNIENISNAKDVFSAAGRQMVATGMDGWRVTFEFGDANPWDKDLYIRKIPNFVDRVWMDTGSEEQSRSDARWGVVLQNLTKDEYDELFPEGSQSGVDQDRTTNVYFFKPKDMIMVGELFYIEEQMRELVLMSDNSVYEVNDDLKKVKDEKKDQGITEVKRKNMPKRVCMTRKFDNQNWLTSAKETVFEFIPLVPTYGNFKISENKLIYRGAIEKNIDEQRVLNYALSRDIEEGALSPRDKIWMTGTQMLGNEDSLETLNSNSDAVQEWNPDPAAPPPFRPDAASPNAGLQTTASNMIDMIQRSSGLSPVAKGDNPGLQSGVAIEQLQRKTDTATIKYFKSQEVAIQHTANILVKAIPKVYDNQRQMRVLGEDGTTSMVMLNEATIDEQTGDNVVLLDLSKGKYDVMCSSGPSFVSRQQETLAAIIEYAGLDPAIIEVGRDVLLNSMDSPGISLIADRVRQQMVLGGQIPVDQLNDEEKQLVAQQQQAQQNQPPDANTMIGMAELQNAETDQFKAQTEAQNDQVAAQQKKQELDRKDFEVELKAQLEGFKTNFAAQAQQAELLTQAVNQLKTLTEAFGIEALAGTAPETLIAQQGEIINETQDNI